ncbi:hypothetical protein [Serratia sp. M24T3]|uniref:hypothetical protein n=1 Tax=Serratia sp. M24T3 TaxID=932213 RepID=UPI0006827C30|nr:hypothetical protein [Serratia sp. M24T3]
MILNGGNLEHAGYWEADLSFVSNNFSDPNFVYNNSGSWLVDLGVKDLSNGCWILRVDDKYDIYDDIFLPGKNKHYE